ncbi:MAG: glutathione S-transferase family protein [Hyphomicrobiales bacterium]|nr:glutathione S-transferase family protein [Hyphomicrobiales bacterium]
MTGEYRIFGSEMSPYSVKVRSYFRYKQIPHRWILRTASNAAEFSKYAKIPVIPLVVAPDGKSLQDSTPLMEEIEAAHPEPAIQPADPALAFLSALLEEFTDEWANKWMFHYRWARDVDQIASAGRIALSIAPAMEEAAWREAAAKIRERMTGRVWFVGSNAQNAPFIEQTFQAALPQLDAHLASRSYLFGARPSLADFGLWGQFYCMWTDPTTGALIEARAPHLLAWAQRMLWPRAEGEFETWSALERTLAPILRDQVGKLFLPWSIANAAAIASGAEEFTTRLDGRDWTQKPQKYHAKSLAALRAKYQAVEDKSALDGILVDAGCAQAAHA